VIVEYSLKVRKGNDGCDDNELIDGCFLFEESLLDEVVRRKVRLFSPLGPLDIRFVYMRFAVEATIRVKVKRAMAGYRLSMVTASTCGYLDEITLYDCRSHPPPMAPREKDGGELLAPVVAVAHAVVAVELGCNLKLRFEIRREDEEPCCGLGRHARKSSHELLFTAQRHKSSKGAIVMSRMFKVAAKITWSTMGECHNPIFHCVGWDRALLGDPHGPCSFE
jgi:hypothetical protein